MCRSKFRHVVIDAYHVVPAHHGRRPNHPSFISLSRLAGEWLRLACEKTPGIVFASLHEACFSNGDAAY